MLCSLAVVIESAWRTTSRRGPRATRPSVEQRGEQLPGPVVARAASARRSARAPRSGAATWGRHRRQEHGTSAGYRGSSRVVPGSSGPHISWKSRLAWAGRPLRLCRPSQARRLDRAEPGARRVQPCRTVPSAAPAGGPGPIVRDPLDVPAHGVRHRDVLGGAVGRTDRHGGSSVDVVRCGCGAGDRGLVGGWPSLGDGSRRHADAAVDVLNGTDVAIVQHEYGIYDGVDGESMLDRPVGRRRCRSIVVAHTVLTEPDAAPTWRARAGLRRSPTRSW